MVISNMYRYAVPLVEKHQGVINVRSYGAKGDGVADDTEAFKAAITAAGVGGSVFVPYGSWPIDGNITPMAGQSIWGVGWGSRLLQTRYPEPILKAEKVDNWRVSGLVFDGGKAINQHIDFTGQSKEGMQISEYGSLVLIRGCNRVAIDGCHFQRHLIGVVSYAAQDNTWNEAVSITNSTFKDLGNQGVLAYRNRRLRLHNLDFDTIVNTQSRAQHGLYINTSNEDVNISGITGTGIMGTDPAGIPSLVQLKSEGGTLTGVTARNCSAVLTMAQASKWSISNISGISLAGSTAGVYSNSGSDNIFADIRLSVTDCHGILIDSDTTSIISDVMVVVNVTADTTLKGVLLKGGAYNVVRNSYVRTEGAKCVAFSFDVGSENKIENPRCHSSLTGVEIQPGVNKAQVVYDPEMLNATTRLSNQGTSSNLKIKGSHKAESIPADTAQPYVNSMASLYRTANTVATTITGFLLALDGQEFTVLAGDANTTVQNNAGVKLTGAVNVTLTSGSTITFISYQGTSYEKARSIK